MSELGPCDARLFTDPFFALCGQPGVAIHDYGCVHEHIKRRVNCLEHAPKPGSVGCWDCLKIGHDCDMVAREVTVSVAKDEQTQAVS